MERNVIVIGDIMIDQYIMCNYKSKSPEANADVLAVQKIENKAGGAANVAASLSNLGHKVFLIGIYGDDTNQPILRDTISKFKNISDQSIIEKGRKTTLKTRVYMDNDYTIRIDNEDSHDLNKNSQASLLRKFENIIKTNHTDAVVLQDYNKGVLTSTNISKIIQICNDQGVRVFVDPKTNNWECYKNIYAFKPNLSETQRALNLVSADIEATKVTAQDFANKNNIENLFLTVGEKGIYHLKDNFWTNYPASFVENPDVCGAGDAVISSIVNDSISNLDISEICNNANKLGAEVCQSFGVTPIK